MHLRKRIVIFCFSIIIMALCGIDSAGHDQWWKLYITQPEIDIARQIDNPEKGLIQTISQAKRYFYGAFYDITSKPIVQALILAKKRGVEVKIITEEDNAHKKTLILLEQADIPIVTDNHPGLMHHKFAIIDDIYLWTGSYNLTENGAYRNNNNALKIYSRLLVKIYLQKFNQMFNDKIFSSRKEAPFSRFRKSYYVKIDDTDVNVYFSPEDNIERIILKRLAKAQKSIHFLAFSFTSDTIGELLVKKFHSGVKVYGLFEKKGSMSKHSEYVKLRVEGLPVKLDKNRYTMHHKVIIIDACRVITGSYNFSNNANKRNEENILIIDNPKLAHSYLKEFYRLYNQ